MKLELFMIVLLCVSFELFVSKVYAQSEPESEFDEREEALEFLTAKRELDAIKRFLYTGKEQRREAKEKYEEKCERNRLLNAARNKPRWCPELTTWDLWNQASVNDKKKSG